MRSLFCMATNDISGGNKVFREWMKLLIQAGQEVHLYVWDKRKQFEGWEALPLVLHDAVDEIEAIDFEFVFFSNTFLVPMLLAHIGNARPVLMAMAYESFHYGKTYEQAMCDKPAFLNVLKLPIAIMAVSEGVRDLLKERAGVDSYYVPHGIEPHFYPRALPSFHDTPKRILMVGSYLSPWKGMQDGFDALELLTRELKIELVLITQRTIGRDVFSKYSFPVEFHCRPDLDRVPEIYTSCHAHLCASWHEGTGMPTLECMRSGVPVVATNNDGIKEFAKDATNILVANRHDPDDIFLKLQRLFSDEQLYEELRKAGIEAMHPYTWDACFALFQQAQTKIVETLEVPMRAKPQEMERILHQLETEGLYTPLETYALFNSLNKELNNICVALSKEDLDAPAAVQRLFYVKEQLQPYVAREGTEYYDSFRASFDLCRLLMSFKDEPQLKKVAATVCRRYQNDNQA